MEMEGRGFSDLLRNTSEEIFLKTMMENPIGITAPSLEMLGFKNITHSFRGDSEELFSNWLSNGETPGYSSSVATHRARQASRRISIEHAPSQQNVAPFQKKSCEENLSTQNLTPNVEHSNDPAQFSLRNAAEKGMQSSNLYLAKAWFNSSQPMTRSRSSELRRRYVAMQSSQMATNPQASSYNAGKVKQELSNATDLCDIPMAEMPSQMHSFMSPSNSSTSFHAAPMATSDAVSSVVSMLKGTLERKKLNNKADKDSMEGCSYNFLAQPPLAASPMQVPVVHGKSLELSMEGFLAQEPSQSESSTAAPTLSTGFDVCDGPTHSGHTISNGVCSSRHGDGTPDYELKANESRERIYENGSKDSTKKSTLVRMGSISSAPSAHAGEKPDPTKRRRVERFRKMTEAKERSCSPALPSDMQAALKRCENLEKEVRSLKLNLSFMNRKDSEQTKQIEELHKQNSDLMNEKERLLEEIERIVSESGQM